MANNLPGASAWERHRSGVGERWQSARWRATCLRQDIFALDLDKRPCRRKKSWPGCSRQSPRQPGQDFFTLANRQATAIPSRVRFLVTREVAMITLPSDCVHESLEIGATPVVRHFLKRLKLPQLFEQHLPKLPGKRPALPSGLVLCVLITNLLLARRPLYALSDWIKQRVPAHLELQPDHVNFFNDDRIGRALDHLRRADRASLLTALIKHMVDEFKIDLSELHQDTTTVTFHGNYAEQPALEQANRPPRITFGYNKDHRPDLKQLLYSVTISADGAVPVHCKTYDGNITDDQVHIETWTFLAKLTGHANFLYVADSKLCTHGNLAFITDKHGRFLTVMPRTRSEDNWFREHIQTHPVTWQEVYREENPRGKELPDIVYHGVESPQRSAEGHRLLWYRSSQKEENDRQARQRRLKQAHARLKDIQGRKGEGHRKAEEAQAAGQAVLEEEQVARWLRARIEEETTDTYKQDGPGRPGPDTVFRCVKTKRYFVRFDEDSEAVARDAKCDGLFPLMTNDKQLTPQDALLKYKYQPFVEKRHAQLKSGFDVTPMWLKNVGRVESMLWLYYVVELTAALLERELQSKMTEEEQGSLPLYPEGRASEAPTASLIFDTLEGRRRHRLLTPQGLEFARFYDPLSPVAQTVLELLDIDRAPYGLE
jgi:transposase